jgi:hypothetical protein
LAARTIAADTPLSVAPCNAHNCEIGQQTRTGARERKKPFTNRGKDGENNNHQLDRAELTA